MTMFLGMPESRGAVANLAREIHGVNDRIKFGVKAMASLGIYPLVKMLQAALGNRAR